MKNKIDKEKILSINAYLKYIEFILKIFDDGNDELTLGEIRKKFETNFKTIHPLLNQNFGIIRLIPLLMIKESYKQQKKELSENVAKIKIIRDSLAHANFMYEEKGYLFKNDKCEIFMTYEEFQKFLHEIENKFYSE